MVAGGVQSPRVVNNMGRLRRQQGGRKQGKKERTETDRKEESVELRMQRKER